VAWDPRIEPDPPEEPLEARSPAGATDDEDPTEDYNGASDEDAATREAVESLLHGDEAEAPNVPVGPAQDPRIATTRDRGSRDAAATPMVAGAAWDVLIRAEQTRWHRYGHPCVAVQLEVVGGRDLASHLGDEAAARVRGALETLLATTTRASDHFEARPPWQVVGLLPETDEAGAAVALDRLQRAFAGAMGPALAVRLAIGLAAPGPGGTLTVAFHQAGRALSSSRRGRPAAGLAAGQPDRADEAPSTAVMDGQPEDLDVGARLDTLLRLLGDGHISEAEYDTKRAEIIDRL
jgi:hypothetical protein